MNSTFNDTFLKACRNEPTRHMPIWFMRQAGRYMAEYRKLREKHTLLEIARTPDLAREVTLQPLQKFDFDAAIIFADILLPLEPMGCPFSFEKGEGPKIKSPIRTPTDAEQLHTFSVKDHLGFVGESIGKVVAEINVPLIGFAGGPFTVCSYMIEGGSSRHFRYAKSFMNSYPKEWHALLEKVSKITLDYLSMQIASGAKAIQLFDSWVGCLSPQDYKEFVFPHSKAILNGIAQKHPDIPRIHFGTGTAMLLKMMHDAGASVMGVDWQTPLSQARKMLGDNVPLQGNLDPISLFAPWEVLEKKVKQIIQSLEHIDHNRGRIFNLGHGILPETPTESVKKVVDLVHELTR